MIKTPGQAAYENYVAKTEGLSVVDGSVLPSWEGLGEAKQEQWNAAALKFAVTKKEIREVLKEESSPREGG